VKLAILNSFDFFFLGSISFRRAAIDLLVDLFQLLCFLLGDVQSDGQVVVVLDQSLDGSSSILEVSAECLALFRQFLHDIGDFNAIESSLS
jgi:hypothetical protein